MQQALIVDDSATARYALRKLLQAHGFEIEMVESAEEALEWLASRRPDLIFMDHMMPGMDGFQAVKTIKSNAATRDIPIIMYTSTQDGVYFGQARALGAADVILKPATAADLAAVLARLEQQQQPATATAPAASQAAPLISAANSAESFAPPAATQPAAPALPPPVAVPAVRTGWLGVATAVLLALALLLGWQLLQIGRERDQLREQRRQVLAALEWVLNVRGEFAFGDAPFDAQRVELLRELLQRLEGLGFRGVVRIESHVGEFCTQRDERSGSWVLAPASLPLTECGALGQSEQQAQRASELQTAAFRRFLARTPALRSGAIRIELAGFGAREPLVEYPADPDVSAGIWNRIAQRNQRLVFRLIPDV